MIVKTIHREMNRRTLYDRLHELGNIIDNNMAIYVYGGLYDNIEKLKELSAIKLIKMRPFKIGKLKFLPIPAPINYLIKIRISSKLPEVIKKLEDIEPLTILIFGREYEKMFLESFDFENSQNTKIFCEDSKCFACTIFFDEEIEILKIGEGFPYHNFLKL